MTKGIAMAQGVNNSKIVKKANRHLVVSTIRESDALSVEELVQKTRLSRPTVLKLLSELEQDHIVEKVGLGESMGGRQPMLYALKLDYHFAVGVDFEFPPIRVAISDIKGNVVFSRQWEQNYGDSLTTVSDAIVCAIRDGMEELGIGAENVIGVGVGIPGLVDINENKPISVARMPEATNIGISQMIEKELGVKTYIRNDAHLIALADRNAFSGLNKNMLYIAYRTGIGMAVFQKGLLYEGECGNSGYLGHTTFDRNGARCSCGQRGCLELYCSKVAMLGKYSKQTGKQAGFEELLTLADKGESAAEEIVTDAAECFGIAVANAVKLFDISLVVIGDLPGEKDDLFLKTVRSAVSSHVSYSREGKITILRGTVEESSYALGGCIFLLDQFFKMPKLKLNI